MVLYEVGYLYRYITTLHDTCTYSMRPKMLLYRIRIRTTDTVFHTLRGTLGHFALFLQNHIYRRMDVHYHQYIKVLTVSVRPFVRYARGAPPWFELSTGYVNGTHASQIFRSMQRASQIFRSMQRIIAEVWLTHSVSNPFTQINNGYRSSLWHTCVPVDYYR